MTLLAFWEVFQLLAFPDSLWLQPHKGLWALGSRGALGCPRSRSVPTRSREEVKLHLTNDGDEEFRSKVTDEVRAPAQHSCWGEAPISFSVGTGVSQLMGTPTLPTP